MEAKSPHEECKRCGWVDCECGTATGELCIALKKVCQLEEQHRTLAAPDAHAARGAWISERSADIITYSKTCGQISRQTIPYKMLID